jgi:hypothetical protein
MASVVPFPTAFTRSAAAGRNPRNADTCGIFDIAGRIGQAHRTPRYICATLDAMILGAGFPAPFPLARGGVLVDGAHRDSRWPLAAVDRWFDDRDPGTAAGVGQAERHEIDSRLSARAMGLFGGARG